MWLASKDVLSMKNGRSSNANMKEMYTHTIPR